MQRIVKSEIYDYGAYRRLIEQLCQKYSVLKPLTIGRSCAGRDIIALTLGSGESYTLFAAAFHGSEYITENVLLYFIEELSYALENGNAMAGINIRKGLAGRGIIFVPLVNPDGCEISMRGAVACGALMPKIRKLCRGDFEHWNANLRGVDINHNFNADWEALHQLERQNGIYGPAPTRFGGYSAESEPETLALCELCRNENIHHAVALHSQGEVIYWGYKNHCYKRCKQMAEIMAATSGYALDVPQGLAVGGGFKDWFLQELERPGFTVELGTGKNPLPITDAASIYATVREMLTVTAIM